VTGLLDVVDVLGALGLSAAVVTVLGYLAGSLSGARIIGRDVDWSSTEVTLSPTGASVSVDAVSPSMLNIQRGKRAGLLAGGIDIGKALVVVLAFRLLVGPDAAAIAGLAVVAGHVLPVYHRFRGGFGVSPLLGTLVVLDPVGLAVALVAGAVLGLIIGSAFAMTEAWPLAYPFWAVAIGARPTYVALGIGAATLYVARCWPVWHAALATHRADQRPWRERVADVRHYP
jgi:glycerol-3-phosphate acyltransferase PlsY